MRAKRKRFPTPELTAWQHIVQRCTNPKCKSWKNYGGRGITVCPEWRESSKVFIAHVGPRPTPKHTIERIDNDGNYEPGNVKWATRGEQNRNRRGAIRITYEGQTKNMVDWAAHFGCPRQSVQYHFKRGRFPPARFAKHRLIMVGGETLSVSEWAKKFGANYQTLYTRLSRKGLPAIVKRIEELKAAKERASDKP